MTKFNKYLFKFVVFTISILTANLLGDYTSNYLTSFKNQYKPLTFTLMAMAIITLIFYPLFEYLDNWVLILSKKLVRKGKSLAGQNFGLILIFIFAMIVLTFFYVKQWYGINIFKYLINPNFDKLI
jgi:hypothetical protein